MFDWLIVGAGFTGATLAERIARSLGKKVLIIDRRKHIGGNAYDYTDNSGIIVHKYGPHIFHTNSKKVWQYLSNFTEWRPYYHKVKAVIDGQYVPIPFNLNSVCQVFPHQLAMRIEQALINEYGYGEKVPILKLRKNENEELRILAKFVYEKVFIGYTIKQWDLKPEELSPSVTARVPVYVSRDDRYFQDVYQAIPLHGYTAMFENMLAHPNIKVMMGADYAEIKDLIPHRKVIYTGQIDELMGGKFGQLPYRSLRFELRTLECESYQEAGTVNYPCEFDYTRITEQKKLTGQKCNKTTIMIEYPQPYIKGQNDPYYPIPIDENRSIYKMYLDELDKSGGDIMVSGRLGDYKYYNMDQAVASALCLFEKKVQK